MAFPKTFIGNTAYAAADSKHLLTFTGVHVGKSIQFLAFIESYNQNFTSTWNTENVYGRNDPIATFQGTQRTLSVNWVVPSGTLEEAKQNLERAASLAQLLYPTYSKGGPPVTELAKESEDSDRVIYTSNALTLSKAPLIRLKYANLIDDASGMNDGLLGFIGSFSWTPSVEMGHFETSSALYPKAISLSIDFTVIHEHDLGWLPDGSAGGFKNFTDFPFGG